MSIWVVELGCKAKIISNTGPAAWWLCPDVCCLSAHVSLLSSSSSMFGLTCQTCHSDLQPELVKTHQSPKYSKFRSNIKAPTNFSHQRLLQFAASFPASRWISSKLTPSGHGNSWFGPPQQFGHASIIGCLAGTVPCEIGNPGMVWYGTVWYGTVCMSVCVRVHACMHAWMDGWMDGRRDGWMDGWMHIYIYIVCAWIHYPWYVCVYLSIPLSICLSTIHSRSHPSIHPSMDQWIYPHIYWSMRSIR